MQITKIEIDGLWNQKKKAWNVNKNLFLYGSNGVGKTSLLELIWFSLKNNLIFQCLDIKENSAQKKGEERPAFKKLQIFFKEDGKERIYKLIGNEYSIDEYNKKNSEITKKLNNNNYQVSKLSDLERSYVLYYEGFLNCETKLKDLENNYNLKIDRKKLLDPVYLNQIKNEFLERGSDQQEINDITYYINNRTNLNNISMNIDNLSNEPIKQKLQSNYDLLFLNIERMMPKKLDRISHPQLANNFEFPQKIQTTPTFKDILNRIETKKNNLERTIRNYFSSFTTHIFKNIIDINDPKEIELNMEYDLLANILKILDFTPENIAAILNQMKDKGSFYAAILKKALNNIDEKIIKELIDENNKIQKLVDILNMFFETSNKRIHFEKFSSSIKVEDSKISDQLIEIKNYKFSSGERQIITILLNVLYKNKDKLLILIDEPELSLSIKWQELLFDFIDEEENVQVIAATHSPFTVSHKKHKEVFQKF